MAKQNFLAGGFYGKLGATVGQRWKNQRTIRTYVIPENPRTPKQMANRNKFTAAVPFAQKGMSMNYRSPAFASETTTEWALRMSSAKYAIDLGQSDVAAIPVVPRGFTSAYTITGISVESVTDATHAKLLLTGSLPAGAKSYSLMIYFSDGSRVGEYMLCNGETTAGDNTDLTITCEDTTDLLTATLYGVIVSNDDIDAQTVTYSARVAIEKAAKPDFTIHIDGVTKTATTQGKLHITLQTSWSGDNLVGTFGISNISFSGNRLTKAAVFAAGGESGATEESFTDNAATASNFTFNRTSGVIEFDITPSNVSTTHKYVGVFVGFNLDFTNAYTDETSMASGFVNNSSGWAGGYLQPEFNTAYTLDNLYMLNYWESSDDGQLTFTWAMSDTDFVAALYDLGRSAATEPKVKLLSGGVVNLVGEESGSFSFLPNYDGMDFNFDDSPNAYINGTFGGSSHPEQELTSGNLQVGSWEVVMPNQTPYGAYDNNHRWTKAPTFTASGEIELW